MNILEYVKKVVFLKVLLKGPPKVGKTYLAASISRLFPVYYIDCEGGLASARNVVDVGNLEIQPIKPESPGAFRKDPEGTFFKPLAAAINEGLKNEKYKALVLDSFSEVCGKMIDEYASRDGQVDLQDWQKVISRARNLGILLRDAPKHVIVTTITKPVDQDDGSKFFDPALPGQASSMVPSFFDAVCLIKKITSQGGMTEHVLVSRGPAAYNCGDRNNCFADVERIDPQNPERVWQKYLNGLSAKASI